MYRNHGDPGWRPTPRVLVTTARECKKLRLEREHAEAERRHALAGPPKKTFAEFKRDHPEVEFPKFGKAIPDD
jgi:hypothetical protein